jgi:hypothetical protein
MANSRNEIEQKIIEKAMKDEEFRNKLKQNPKSAVEETLGVKLPDDVNLNINMESANEIHITIPHSSQELSQEELSGVSGGWDACSITAM